MVQIGMLSGNMQIVCVGRNKDNKWLEQVEDSNVIIGTNSNGKKDAMYVLQEPLRHKFIEISLLNLDMKYGG